MVGRREVSSVREEVRVMSGLGHRNQTSTKRVINRCLDVYILKGIVQGTAGLCHWGLASQVRKPWTQLQTCPQVRVSLLPVSPSHYFVFFPLTVSLSPLFPSLPSPLPSLPCFLFSLLASLCLPLIVRLFRVISFKNPLLITKLLNQLDSFTAISRLMQT